MISVLFFLLLLFIFECVTVHLCCMLINEMSNFYCVVLVDINIL